MAYAFHQTAITGDDIGEMIDKIATMNGRHVRFRHCHPDCVGKTLAKWAGRRLDATGMADLRMTGGDRTDLAEVAELRHRHVFIAGQVKKRIDEHRAVPGGKNEPVAVWPVRRRGIELQMVGEQRRGDIGHAHRHAGVT